MREGHSAERHLDIPNFTFTTALHCTRSRGRKRRFHDRVTSPGIDSGRRVRSSKNAERRREKPATSGHRDHDAVSTSDSASYPPLREPWTHWRAGCWAFVVPSALAPQVPAALAEQNDDNSPNEPVWLWHSSAVLVGSPHTHTAARNSNFRDITAERRHVFCRLDCDKFTRNVTVAVLKWHVYA